MTQLAGLFQDHRNLLEGFNAFLPPMYHINIPVDGGAITFTGPNGDF